MEEAYSGRRFLFSFVLSVTLAAVVSWHQIVSFRQEQEQVQQIPRFTKEQRCDELKRLIQDNRADAALDCFQRFSDEFMLACPPLVTAAAVGSINATQWLLANGLGNKTHVNSCDVNGTTALAAAALFCRPEIVKLFLGSGADVSICNNKGDSALSAVINHTPIHTKECEEVISLLLQASINNTITGPLKAVCEVGEEWALQLFLRQLNASFLTSCLSFAAASGRQQLLVPLLQHGANPDGENSSNCPLITCAMNNNLACVETLVHYGANINSHELEDGMTALMFAAQKRQTELTRFLLAGRGVDLNARNKKGATALLIAVTVRNHRIIEMLAEQGADVNVEEPSTGLTPMIAAAVAGDTGTIEVLMRHEATINVQNCKGISPLAAAVISKRMQTAEWLMEKAVAEVDLKLKDGWTALFFAVSRNNAKAARLLIEKGADPNVQSSDGATPLIIAASRGFIDLVKNLIDDWGANMDLTTDDGMTALDVAIFNRRKKVEDDLRKRGKKPHFRQ